MISERDRYGLDDYLAGVRAQAALEAAVRKSRPKRDGAHPLLSSFAVAIRGLANWLDPEPDGAEAALTGADRHRHERRTQTARIT